MKHSGGLVVTWNIHSFLYSNFAIQRLEQQMRHNVLEQCFFCAGTLNNLTWLKHSKNRKYEFHSNYVLKKGNTHTNTMREKYSPERKLNDIIIERKKGESMGGEEW